MGVPRLGTNVATTGGAILLALNAAPDDRAIATLVNFLCHVQNFMHIQLALSDASHFFVGKADDGLFRHADLRQRGRISFYPRRRRHIILESGPNGRRTPYPPNIAMDRRYALEIRFCRANLMDHAVRRKGVRRVYRRLLIRGTSGAY